MPDDVRDAYDTMTGRYATFALGDLDRVPTDRDPLATFAELAVLGDGAVADLGCGSGHIVHHLTGLGLTTLGYDIAPAMVAEARRAFPDSAFQVGDLAGLDIADASLAGIVARYSLIHERPTRHGAIFREWFRVLEPGAPVLVSFFAAASAETHGSTFDHAVTTAYELFPATIAEELRAVGFDRFEITTRRPLDGERRLDHATVLARRCGD